MIQWIVGEGSASYYFADLAIAGTFPPSNGGILPANSTYLLWYVLCPDQHIVVLAMYGLHNLAEFVAVLVLNGQVNAGNNDEGKDWL